MTDLAQNADWLKGNQTLRMDANSELFPEDRRQFHLDRYAFAQPYCAGKTVLDAACGTGYGTALLGEVAQQAVGIDCAGDAVDYARGTYAKTHIGFERSFVELTPFADSAFDRIVSFETVEHTLCPRAHMMEIARLLKPQGMAILSVPNAWGYTDHHFFDFDLRMLRELTSDFFGRSEFFYQNPRSHPTSPGIGPLSSNGSSATPSQAQCILALCYEPRKERIAADRLGGLMDEIYRNAFERHNAYRGLAYRQNTSLLRRGLNKLRSMMR